MAKGLGRFKNPNSNNPMNTTIKQISRLRLTAVVAGSIVLSCSLAMAQTVRQNTPEAQNPTGTSVTVATQNQVPPPIDDDIIMLSPFQVDASKDKGYFAENTLAGSRMRVNVSDLGAAISVVTKQQMEDTASLDINDVFRYEIGTEGTWTYTPTGQTFRADGVADAIAGNTFGNNMTGTVTNSTANRVRGLGSPDYALNYYKRIAQIPFDSYNAASIEINRGPNSLLFGIGSPAGIVNMTTAQALIGKNTGQVQIRIDDRGSNRASFNFNKTLFKNKLAIYGALLYDDRQYERKPSYDMTRRQYGAITYKPFKGTTIRASIEGYSNDNRRPNSIMPRDGVTEWRKAGMPYYDSTTQQILSYATGSELGVYSPSMSSPNAQQLWDFLSARGYTQGNADPNKNISPVAASSTDPTTVNYSINGVNIFGTTLLGTRYFSGGTENPFYVPIGFQTGRAFQQISNGALQYWSQGSLRQATSFNASGAKQYAFSTTRTDTSYIYNNPAWAAVYDRAWTESALWTRPNEVTGIYGALYPTVSDTSIYDWKNVNILSMNYASQRNTTYNIELEQEIIPNLLHFTAGWFRQDFDSMQSYTVANMNATTLQVDTNIYYPDGTKNPYFGRVYVVDQDPDRYGDSWSTDEYRAMLAFTPDFTKNKGWTKWLGRHQILGLASYLDEQRTTFRRRIAYYHGSAAAEIQYMGWQESPSFSYQSSNASKRYFYLSDSGDAVTQAVGAGAYNDDLISGTIRLYDYASGQWNDHALSMIWPDFNNGTTRNGRTLTSFAAAWNGYLWEDRIITTIGVRRDINKTRAVSQGALNGEAALSSTELFPDGYLDTSTFFNRWDQWSRQAGTTKSMGAVVKPFLHWNWITKRSADNLFWEFVENLGFSYNKSDNFNPAQVTQVDFFGNVLPKPVGNGKDYGVQFSLLKGKLYARVNWFESTNENAIQSPIALQRLSGQIDTWSYRSWLGFIYMLNDGLDPINDADWTTTLKKYIENDNAAVTADVNAMQTWAGDKWGLGNWKYYDKNYIGGNIAGTSMLEAKGVEVTIQFNPTSNWTIKFTASKNETRVSNVLKEYDAWHAYRYDAWDHANAADYLTGDAKTKYANKEVTDSTGRKIYMGSFWDSYGYYDSNSNGITLNANSSDPAYQNAKNYYNAVLVPYEYSAKASEGRLVDGQRKYNATVVTNYMFDRGALKGWSVGGAQRYSSKSVIGYYGASTGTNLDSRGNALLDIPDVNRPIYDDAQWYTDLWVAYTRKIFNDKVRMKLQLNVSDVFQSGGLKPIAVDYNGDVTAYRIMDPRVFILSATFDF
jgi:hypothetical protein